ncbi:MAG: sugar transferase [Elusimicrobia bacterium]|nr:sugar transferase [Elusimicrobiota bacterium]
MLLTICVVTTATILDKKDAAGTIAFVAFLAWLPAILLADKYVHKYPQRYFTYLLASHFKSAVIMAFFLWLIGHVAGYTLTSSDVVWRAFVLFVLADAFVSAFCRREILTNPIVEAMNSFSGSTTDRLRYAGRRIDNDLHSINTRSIPSRIPAEIDRSLLEFIRTNLPDQDGKNADLLVLDDLDESIYRSGSSLAGVIVCRTRVNYVRRLNQFLMFCAGNMEMGGYLVLRYMPLENVVTDLKRRYPVPIHWPVFVLHFIWHRAFPKIPWLHNIYFSSKLSWLDRCYLALTKRRNRVLSKAEVWGRLAYWGLQVVKEAQGDGEICLIARRVEASVQNKRPSYYPIVALEKVGLDGKIMRTHKIRSMFPFSEFLQKRIFEDNGLAPTGKFANDFRLTEYGNFLRKYWLDELPQIYDWLRGDLKLVGMRATSPHFLSLYPKELHELYIQIKPGLIPPIFDAKTNGFSEIVQVEFAYLKSYMKEPFLTDVRYFMKTFTDIVFRGVRSR